MAFKGIAQDKVPAFEIVQSRIHVISSNVTIADIGHDCDSTAYRFVLNTDQGRSANLDLSRELLEDLRDNPSGPNSRYTFELTSKLNEKIREAIESNGLISYSDEALKYTLLRYIVKEHGNGRTIHKYNTIGRGAQGDFERDTRTVLSTEEKDSLIWCWGELMRLRVIAPTGTDLVVPDEWVKPTEKGIAAVQARTFTEYEEIEVFVAKGEVFTAFRVLQRIFQQARTKVIIIDPYVDETVLDHIAELNPSIQVKVITEHLLGQFKTAYSKLQAQRGNVEVRTATNFHDRFIILDDEKCYQLGSSINHIGKKSTVIDGKNEPVRDKILAEFAKTWSVGTSV